MTDVSPKIRDTSVMGKYFLEKLEFDNLQFLKLFLNDS